MNAITDTPRDAEGTSTPDDALSTVVQWVEDVENQLATANEKAGRDRDYVDGRQLTHEEAAELKKRNQPVIAFNLTQAKVDYLCGLEKQQRSDPKAFPRTPQHEQDAEAATDSIRYVCDIEDMQMIASGVWDNMIVEGAGGVDVCVEEGPEGYEIKLKRVHWDRMIADGHSREQDYSDAKFLGMILWMDESDLLARWPDAGDIVRVSYDTYSQTDTYDDRPRWNIWADRRRKRVRVVQLYWRTGNDWRYGAFTKGGWLDQEQASPYVDERGNPDCPLVFVSAYINRDNERYGVVRALIDPQDEINLRHRKAVHLLSTRQVIAEQGAVQDVDAARQELAKPDGYIEVAPGMRFEIQQTADLSTGQAQLLQEAKSVFQAMGPNAALMGKQGAEASGRAIALSQQGGAMEIGALLDIHRHWRRRVYRQIWSRIRQYWTAEKWVRVTDDERNIRFVGLNTPEIDPMTGQPAIDPYTGQPVIRNNVAQMQVDIVVEEGPDVATLQIEQFEALAGLAKAGVPIPPDILIEASTLRNKDKILERMRGGGENAQPPPPDPAVVAAQQRMELDAAKAQQDAALKQQTAMQDAQLKREMAALDAEIARQKAQSDADLALYKANLDAQTKMQVAAMQPAPEPMPAAALVEPDARIDTLLQAVTGIAQGVGAIAQDVGALGQRVGGLEARVVEMAEDVAAPSQIVRDASGKPVGVQKGKRTMSIARDAQGRAMGLA